MGKKDKRIFHLERRLARQVMDNERLRKELNEAREELTSVSDEQRRGEAAQLARLKLANKEFVARAPERVLELEREKAGSFDIEVTAERLWEVHHAPSGVDISISGPTRIPGTRSFETDINVCTENVEDAVDDIVLDWPQTVADRDARIAELETEIAQRKSGYYNHDLNQNARIEELESDLNEAEKQCRNWAMMGHRADQELDVVREERDALNTLTQTMYKRVDQLNETIEERDTEIAELKETRDKLMKMLRRADDRRDSLVERLHRAQLLNKGGTE